MFFKKINSKQILFPGITSLGLFQYNKYNKEITNIKRAKCGGQNEDDEGKINTGRSINQRMYKIEQKLNFLIDRENYKVELKDFPRFNKNNTSILKRILDESTWRRNYMLKTEEGYDINDIIQSGLDNQDHPLGMISPSKDAYYTFEEILVNAASQFHNRNIRLTKFEKENYTLLKNVINTIEDLLNNSIQQIEITTHRNLDGFSFPSRLTRNNRREVARSILNVIKSKENEVFEESGKFLSLENNSESFIQNPFYRSSGFYRDWPDARFIYVNNNQSLTLIVNEEDHLKLTEKLNDFNETSLKYLLNYFDLLDKLDSKLSFAFDDNLGYLNSLVNNLGSATYFNIKLKVTSPEEFKNHFKNTPDLDITLDLENNSVDVSNITSFYTFSQFLIDLVNAKHFLSTK